MAAITVDNVWKRYRIFHDKRGTLKEKILFRKKNTYEDKWVLRDINLEVQTGEVFGLIGANGSGKSTLLKLMTRIIYPNKGTIDIQGKVSSLLELGAGFHPDMNGIENIYTNASIFGLTRSEIDRKLDDIISFSELEGFIDVPVRTYSSGMYTRLAFSVAINVDAEVLLIDEVLSVGDAYFQAKCFKWLQKLKEKGITIVIVSHDLESIVLHSNRVAWLNDGEIKAIGNPQEVTDKYIASIS